MSTNADSSVENCGAPYIVGCLIPTLGSLYVENLVFIQEWWEMNQQPMVLFNGLISLLNKHLDDFKSLIGKPNHAKGEIKVVKR